MVCGSPPSGTSAGFLREDLSGAGGLKHMADLFPTLSDDEIEAIGNLLAKPLAPHLVVALSSCSRGLRRALEGPLTQLKERRQKVEELCAHVNANGARYREYSGPGGGPWSCDVLRDASDLSCSPGYPGPPGRFTQPYTKFTAAHVETLGMLLTTNGLPQLSWFSLDNQSIGDGGVPLLFGELGRQALPSLKQLHISHNDIGNAGAATLASALGRGVMPCLQTLGLGQNRIGNQGLIALAKPLRTLPTLACLWLDDNQIGDEGAAALVAPGEGVLFPKLCLFTLERNVLTESGFAQLAVGLECGAMPCLVELTLVEPDTVDLETWVCPPALQDVYEARPALRDETGQHVPRREGDIGRLEAFLAAFVPPA